MKPIFARRVAFPDSDGLFALFTVFVFAVALTLGGATGKWVPSDGIVMILAGPLLVWAVVRLQHDPPESNAKLGLTLFAAVAVLQILHLVPLPPAVWTALPGREGLVTAMRAAGVEPGWAPVSIAPWATLYGLAAFIVPAALFAAILTLKDETRSWLVWGVLIASVFNVSLGAAQIAGGQESWLRFFEFTNVFQPVGIFANANHLACFLAIAIPFAAAEAANTHRAAAVRWLCAGCAVLSLAGVATTASRAGLGLAAIACTAAGLAVSVTLSRRKINPAVTIGLVIVTLTIVAQFGLAGLVRRSEIAGQWQGRVFMAEGASAAATAYFPLGSGFGTTRTAYAMFEQPALLLPTIVNQVHNDYLQLWLEGGIPGVLLGLAVLAMVGRAIFHRIRGPRLAASVAPAACLVVVLAHSLVDYPMRTLAIQAALALSLALLLGRLPAGSGAAAVSSNRQNPGSRHDRAHELGRSRRDR